MVAQNSGMCLDVNGWQTQPGLNMDQWTCSGNQNQNFIFSLQGNGTYIIQPQIDGLCLDTASNGWQVIQNTCNGSPTQQWTLQPTSSGPDAIVSSTGACLNVSGNSTQNGGNMILWSCVGSSNEQFAVAGVAPHVPDGLSGSFQPLIDATFGSSYPDSSIHSRSDLDNIAYYWFEYGPSNTDPPYWAQSAAPNNCMGPSGPGTDGLYGNFYSRFMHCTPGSPWDRHVLGTQYLTLKANCGLTDDNPSNCADGNIGGGMLRFIESFRPTADHPIIIEMKAMMPKGMYSWPAFWLNPGQQAPRNADDSPGNLISSAWPPEIDIFDEYGFNNTPPGHYLILATPTGGNDATYASSLCSSQRVSVCDLPLTPGGPTLPTTSVATFNSWYATTNADLTAGMHVYGARIYPDHVDALLDGVVYRSRGYSWPASSPPMQLIVSNQTGAKFNDLSGIVDQGGVPNGWDWNIAYVRVWQQN